LGYIGGWGCACALEGEICFVDLLDLGQIHR
jgi:hypothetical protein